MNANKVAPKTNPQMKRIRTMSRMIKALFLTYLLAAGLVSILLKITPLLHGSSHSWRIFDLLFAMMYEEFPMGLKLLYALGAGILLSVVITIYRLLDLYERGTVFSLANVRLYKRLGCLAIGYGLLDACGYKFAVDIANRMTATDIVTHLEVFLFEATSSPWIIGGIFVVMISLIMEEACKLREEQELTV